MNELKLSSRRVVCLRAAAAAEGEGGTVVVDGEKDWLEESRRGSGGGRLSVFLW